MAYIVSKINNTALSHTEKYVVLEICKVMPWLLASFGGRNFWQNSSHQNLAGYILANAQNL